MVFAKDLRDWLKMAEGIGQVKVVEGATWQEDIGKCCEMLSLSKGGPAVIFDNIPGFKKGYRVLGNPLNDDRIALTFGIQQGLPRFELSQEIYKKTSNVKPILHKYVTDGPIMENVHEGDDINLLEFPTPRWHVDDGGRYIGTGSYDVTRDPDNGWVNLGTYRVMVDDEKHAFFYISPGKHGRIHRDKFFARKEPCPVVVVAGGCMLTMMAGAVELPFGLTEYDWVGGVKGEPVEVFKGKYTGLPIPADAEIAIEGFAHYDDVKKEGPFGEWTGYYASAARVEPRIEIKAIYHRNDPIILGFPPYRPPDGQGLFRAFMRSPLLKEELEKAGVPDVTAAWCHEVGGSRLFTAVAIKQRYPGHATQAGHIAAQCHVGAYCGKYIVVVDDDVDVTDLEEVVWAMVSRSDPATNIDIIHRAWSTHLDPRIHPEDKEKGALWNSRAVIDACRPFEWRNKFPKVNLSPIEIRSEVKKKFDYLLK